MKKRVLIAGGGTGGHVYPALAIIEALKEKAEIECLYVGGKNGIETRIVPPLGIPMATIWIAGFSRSWTLKNLLFPVKLLSSLFKSRQIIRQFAPDVAVGTGGYVSGPPLYVAAKMKVPVLIQEQDAYPGVTTRLLAKYARRVCLSFEAAQKHFPELLEKLTVTGNPIRGNLDKGNRQKAIENWDLEDGRKTIFIFGGSQGARSINIAMSTILPEILEKYDVQVLWQTGRGQFESVMAANTVKNDRVKIVPYVEKMNDAYACADLIVCRAGASSLAELALVAKPTVLVPYPYAAGDHQVHNSRMMADAGAALMVQEGERWEIKLQSALEKILDDEKLQKSMPDAWQEIARPNAAAEIAGEILALANEK